MISVQASGSICSARAVEPLTSQNKRVTMRRSPTMLPLTRAASSLAASSGGMAVLGMAAAIAAGADGASPASGNSSPHLEQKRAVGRTGLPQRGQFTQLL